MKIIHKIYKQIRIICLCSALVMYFLAGLGDTDHIVLCFGDDCHVSVEEVLNDNCTDCCAAPNETNSISSLIDTVALNANNAGCCVYFPILKDNISELLVLKQRNLITTQIAVPQDLSEYPLIFSESLSSVHITTLNPTLSSLRTVTILI